LRGGITKKKPHAGDLTKQKSRKVRASGRNRGKGAVGLEWTKKWLFQVKGNINKYGGVGKGLSRPNIVKEDYKSSLTTEESTGVDSNGRTRAQTSKSLKKKNPSRFSDPEGGHQKNAVHGEEGGSQKENTVCRDLHGTKNTLGDSSG